MPSTHILQHIARNFQIIRPRVLQKGGEGVGGGSMWAGGLILTLALLLLLLLLLLLEGQWKPCGSMLQL